MVGASRHQRDEEEMSPSSICHQTSQILSGDQLPFRGGDGVTSLGSKAGREGMGLVVRAFDSPRARGTVAESWHTAPGESATFWVRSCTEK